MQNPYLKQYPDLMQGKKILYIHGFGSSAQSGTVKLIQTVLPSADVMAYDLPLHPEEALALLRRVCSERQPDLILGTSMGGMYAEMMYGYDRICVNPAFEMGETMHSHDMMGRQTYQNPRQDGVQEFFVDKPLVKEYKAITEQCFGGVTAEEQTRCYGLFGDEDDVVHTFDLFRAHYTQAIRFHGGHRLDDRSFMHGVLPVVRWIDDRQQRRERPIVYVDFSTLHDDYMKPRSSMAKAYGMLCERYQVYVVAPAPANEPAQMAAVQAWVEQYLSTPAYDRVIYTNRKALLYGDYLVDTAPDDDAMATTIAFGSDEFKTWEEVITYYERLGGQ